MLKAFIEKVIGNRNERIIKKLWPIVEEINEIYEEYHSLSDEDIPKKTEEFIQRIVEGEDPDDILPEAFALVKEAARRLVGKKWLVTGETYEWDMIPFDVQLIGGIVLHQGKIAEMATGEGKTLVATMPLYLNAIIGRARGLQGDKRFIVNGEPRGIAHLVTVNDYLARRDREWMGPLYESLGLTVGVIQSGMTPDERIPAYNADITYGTNNEFGFDYLRDNMVYVPEHRVQRGHVYAIIDEVDSILIDEARTPLIISGPVEHSNVEMYREMKPVVETLVRHQINLVNKWLFEAEKLLAQGKNKEAAKKIVLAKYGHPKAKKLFKLLQEPGLMKLVDQVEMELMKKELGQKEETRLKQLQEENLFYVVDEKAHSVDLTEKGREQIRKYMRYDVFELPDLSTLIHEIDQRTDLTPTEKFFEKEKIYREYADKRDKVHAINQLLKAYSLFQKDVDYVVMNGQVIIVDEFTGRLMPGRRWSDGLHEAVEAKEGVKIQAETQTLATITIQNYFRMYEKLAGMTGTAATEAAEFWEIYKLDVVTIPTNKPVRRVDFPDIIYKTKKEKYEAVINEIEKWHKVGRPVLVGTTSVEVSELLSRMLRRRRIPHEVLNAKHHKREAKIVAKAGQFGAVTIATNMAGRGTDIKLGPGVIKAYEYVHGQKADEIKKLQDEGKRVLGIVESESVMPQIEWLLRQRKVKFESFNLKEAPERLGELKTHLDVNGAVALVVNITDQQMSEIKDMVDKVYEFPQPECAIRTKNPRPGITCPMDPKKCMEEGVPCGLYVIGTERHESRRIDNQLRGRSGRQGDPGASKFFLSLEDDLLRLFGSDRVMEIMERWGKSDEGPIESKLVTRALENAQKRVEMQNFQIRKRLLEYDDVMNRQREAIYGLRNEILDGKSVKDLILGQYLDELIEELLAKYAPKGRPPEEWDFDSMIAELSMFFLSDFTFVKNYRSREEIAEAIREHVTELYAEREEAFGEEKMREIERRILLMTLDTAWREHLYALDHLKEGIQLRAYAQKDPLVQYKQESYQLFDELLTRIRNETLQRLFRIQKPEVKLPKRYASRMVEFKPAAQNITGKGQQGQQVRRQVTPPAGVPVGVSAPTQGSQRPTGSSRGGRRRSRGRRRKK